MLPVPLSTNKCIRCNLRYPREELHCPHCHDLSDDDVKYLISMHQEESKKTKKLGLLFGLFSFLIIIFLLAFVD
jgi:RNA polymerase subunit RPABC4/transcription elongation factor Spt4